MRTLRRDVKEAEEVLHAMHTLTFPEDSQPEWQGTGMCWITYDGSDPVAFIYAEPMPDGSLYFSRVGVMPAARGKGLQRKLMRLMVKAARAGGHPVIVSTTYQNPPSANNFVREQWLTYLPVTPWGSPDTIYWRKDL